MSQALRPILEFAQAGGVTMIPLLICCTAMWYLILRAWFDLLLPQCNGHDELASSLDPLCSGCKKQDARLAKTLAEAIHQRIRRRLSGAAIFATAAPLLGLLGTVTGMMETFDSVARFGEFTPQAVSSGISQAMISTQTGLVVAVPGVVMVYVLRRRSKRYRMGLKRFGIARAVSGGRS